MLKLHKAQQKIAQSTKRYRFVRCGRRFGKTEFAIEDIVATAVHNQGKVLYIAPTQTQARDIIWDKLKRRVEEFAIGINEQRLEIRVPNNKGDESLIVLGSWEKVENLRGNEFIHIVLDEVREMKKAPGFFYYWKNTLKPTLLTTNGTADFLSTPNGFDHFYDLEQEALQSPEEWDVFHFTSHDNPFNPPEELEKLEKNEPEDVFAQEYMADYRKKQGLVYKEFNRERHIYQEANMDTAEILGGLDFGFRNPAAFLRIVKDRQGHYWITDEWYETEKTHDQIAEYVYQTDVNKLYPDPASPEAIEVLRKKGVNCMEVVKGNDSITAGINKIKALLKQGRLHIHSSCINLIWEFENYAYMEKRNNSNEPEAPIKENDHAMDSLRYVILMNDLTPHVNRVNHRHHYQTRQSNIKARR